MSPLSRVAILFVALALVAPAVPAVAHDHKRPNVMLRSHGERQRGLPYSFEWTRADGKVCAAWAGDGIPNYRRKAMPWNPENPLHLYLYKRQKPDKVGVRMHRRLDDDDFPTGRGRRAEISLRRKVMDSGRRIWIADFTAPDRRRWYLSARAVWQDVEGCGGAQSLDMALHIRRK
jgi:hypothetical protein